MNDILDFIYNNFNLSEDDISSNKDNKIIFDITNSDKLSSIFSVLNRSDEAIYVDNESNFDSIKNEFKYVYQYDKYKLILNGNVIDDKYSLEVTE